MRKRLSVGVATLLILVMSAVAALAAAPTLLIEKIGGEDVAPDLVLTFSSLDPAPVIDVQVKVSHNDGSGDVMNRVDDLKLFVKSLPDGEYVQMGSTVVVGPQNGCGAQATSCTFQMPWTIAAFGDYALKATAIAHKNSVNEATGEATAVEVEIAMGTQISVEFPAAPAIANHYLDDPDVQDACRAVYSGRNWRGQIIQQVADWQVEDGVNKKLAFQEIGTQEAYDDWEALVHGFVDGLCE